MRDVEIRRAFHDSILKSDHGSDDVIVIDELGLKNGLVRADIAVINGEMVGYEIKTERDTLKRLPTQVSIYNEVFDRAFIITSKKHLTKVRSVIPKWWGIYEIVENIDGIFSFKCRRKSRSNQKKNSLTIAQLLWKAEALEIANNLIDVEIKTSATKRVIFQEICKNYRPEELSKIVIRYLKQRDTWRLSRPLLS